METVSDNLGQIEICTPEDANAMIDLAQKMVELRGTIELDPHADQTRDFDADFPNLGAFRANVVEGGNIPGRS